MARWNLIWPQHSIHNILLMSNSINNHFLKKPPFVPVGSDIVQFHGKSPVTWMILQIRPHAVHTWGSFHRNSCYVIFESLWIGLRSGSVFVYCEIWHSWRSFWSFLQNLTVQENTAIVTPQTVKGCLIVKKPQITTSYFHAPYLPMLGTFQV